MNRGRWWVVLGGAVGAALPGGDLRLGRVRAGAQGQPLRIDRHALARAARSRSGAACRGGRRISRRSSGNSPKRTRTTARRPRRRSIAILKETVPARIQVPDSVWARHHYGFSGTQAQAVFATGIMVFAIVMIFAGRWQDRAGPRVVAITGGLVLAAGYAIAGLAGPSFPVVLLAIGVIGGAGIGLGYVCPVAACIKWFPDLKGVITGLAVAGFGGGSFLFIKLAGSWGGLLPAYGVPGTFLVLRGDLCRGDYRRRVAAAQSAGRLAAPRLATADADRGRGDGRRFRAA